VYDFWQDVPQATITDNIIEAFKRSSSVHVDLRKLIAYLSIAREYSPIKIVQNQRTTCPRCSSTQMLEENEGEVYCEDCGFIADNRLSGIKDIECINTCKSYYSLKGNLLRTIRKYEGRKSFIDENDLQKIKKEIANRRFRLSTLRVEHLIIILKDLKMNKYYEEARTIFNIIHNKTLQKLCISQYIPQILRLHEELEYAYNFVKNPERKNTLNVHYKLFKLLQLCGVECNITDFYTLKTEQKFDEHEYKWRQIC
jgi:ribosomal protein S27AE